MKKRILSACFAFILMLCPFILSACGDKDPEDTTPTITKIEVVGEFKTTYFVGEDLIIDNLEIKITKSDETTSNVALTSEMISGFDSTTAGEKTLTITYNEKTTTVAYTVISPTVKSIAISTSIKNAYFTGDILDLEGTKLNVVFEDDSSASINVTSTMVTGFDTSTAGTNKELTITYGDKSIKVTYNVTQLAVSSISVKTKMKTSYFVGEQLEVAGGIITATYNNGKTEDVVITNAMVSNFSTTSAKNAVLTITYEGKTCSQEYSVTAIVVSSIELLNRAEFKTAYYTGDAITYPCGQIKATYNNGTTQTVNITETMVTGFDSSSAGEDKVLTISYGGKTTTIAYTITDIVATSISILPENQFKTIYFVGELLDTTGGKLNVEYNNGNTEVVDILPSMVIGFDSQFEKSGNLTIAWGGISINVPYTVTIVKVTSVSLEPGMKTTYYQGQSLDVTGGKIKATYNNGKTEVVDVELYMLKSKSTSQAKTYTTQIITDFEDENGDFFTISFSYTVIARTITLTTPFKLVYVVGEDLDVDGGQITITYGDETPDEIIEITADMVKNFSTTTAGSKTLKIQYDGLTSSLIEYVVNEA